jgi:dephospho-CoA kinase
MLQVGVTGGIGSGKTLVCSVLEQLGVPVYHADLEARRLMNEDLQVREKIIDLFGEEAYLDGALNRGFIAGQVFGDQQKLSRLNALVHPAVRQDYTRWVAEQLHVPYVVEEAAILFESGAAGFMDLKVLVYAPEPVRIKRVMKRDGVLEGNVRERMRNQMDEEEKRRLSDLVIMNDGETMLLPQVIDVHREILKRIE